MKIGVPGEFHEDRWQRTAEDSERCMFPRTREVGRTIRIQVIAWRGGLVAGLRHGDHAHRYLWDILGVAKRDFWTVFDTATLPTGTSVPSRRGEEGLLTGLRPVRRSAYSENAGIRCARPARLHIQRPGIRRTCPAPGIFSGPRHIQRVPGVSVAVVDAAG